MTEWKFKQTKAKNMKWPVALLIGLLGIALLLYPGVLQSMIDKLWHTSLPAVEPVIKREEPAPDFKSYTITAEKKQAFFNYIRPFVQVENARLKDLRQSVIDLQDKSKQEALTGRELKWLRDIHKSYKLELEEGESFEFDELLRRVDIIPPSLALAQAAIESAWGMSRFATQANNYFGHWCYSRGCGLVPKKRAKGAKHEVRKFKSARGSTIHYMKNLNTQHAYQDFRKLRAQERKSKADKLSGVLLSRTLINYSQEREHYLKKLNSMIKNNNLAKLDQAPFPEPES